MEIDSIWSEPEQLPFNSDNYSVAHPALSPDEKTLYFTSDMHQAIGESDIFKVSINENGSFGTPREFGISCEYRIKRNISLRFRRKYTLFFF